MKLSKKYIFKHIEDVDVFKGYLQIDDTYIRGKGGTKNMKSVFAESDNNPSMSVFISKSGDCMYKCHKTDKKGDCIQLVRDLKNLSFVDAMKDICKTFNIPLPERSQDLQLEYKGKVWIAETIDFTDTAKSFLESKDISAEVAKKYQMQQLKSLKYKSPDKDKFAKFNYITEDNEILAFQYKVKSRFKLYVPKQENKKGEAISQKYFLKTQNQNDVFGWDQLPKRGQEVVICEGETDTLKLVSNRYNAVCFQSSSTVPTDMDAVIRELKNRFKNVFICYDNDDAGNKHSKKIAFKYNLIRIQLEEEGADICDTDIDYFEAQRVDALSDWRTDNEINLHERGCSYFVYDHKKERQVKISDFTISSKALIIGKEQSNRIVTIKTRRGETKPFATSTDDFLSPNSFRRLALSKVNEGFWGSAIDLANIQRKVFDLCPVVQEVQGVGYNEELNKYIFPNLVIGHNGEPAKPNQFGIFKDVYIPCANESNKNNPHFKDQLNYSFKNDSSMNFKEFSKSITTMNGAIKSIFFASLAVGSTTFHHVSRRVKMFPILNLKGQKGSGKTVASQFILGLYNQDPQVINIRQTTQNGFIRLFTQTPNIPVILDEFKNNIGKGKIESLKGIYNLTGRLTANFSNDNTVKKSAILSPCILAGQESVNDEALLSRLITLNFPVRKFSKLEKETFKKMEIEMQKGFGNILIEIIKHQQYIIDNFDDRYYKLMEYFSNESDRKGINVQRRLVKNYAAYLAPLELAIENGLNMDFDTIFKELGFKEKPTIDLKIDCVRTLAMLNLSEQAKNEESADEVNVLLDLINDLQEVNNPDLGIFYNCDYGYNRNTNEFYMTSSVIDKARMLYEKRNKETFTDRKSIISYLTSSQYYTDNKRKSLKTSASKTNTKQKRCYILKLDLIEKFIELPTNQNDE